MAHAACRIPVFLRFLRRLVAIGAFGAPLVAHATVENRLKNGDFEEFEDGAGRWEETNKWDYKPGDLLYVDEEEPGNSQVVAYYLTDGLPGSIWVNDVIGYGGSGQSAVIYPDPNPLFAGSPPVLTQEIPTSFLAGRTPIITGAWLRSSGSNLGIRVTLKYATTTGSGTSEVGEWNTTNCVFSDSSFDDPDANNWDEFSFGCSAALPNEKIWEAQLIIEPIGTFATGAAIRVDNLQVKTDDAQTYSGSWTQLGSGAFDVIPDTADLIGTSTRHSEDPPSVDGGVTSEVYAMRSDGSDATRLTHTGYGYGPVTVNPIDHTQIAVVRFTIDWDDNDTYSILTDPARVFVLDLDEDKEFAVTPVYWSSGLGGVEWTTDGKYIVFGVSPGGNWEIWKADAENGFALSRVTTDTEACVESDVNVANYGRWIAYRKAAMTDGKCYPPETKGDLVLVHPDDPANTQTVVFEDAQAGVSSDKLPFGAYDPAFLADDSGLIFSYSVPDDGDPDDRDTYDTYLVPITGALPADSGDLTYLFGFDSLNAEALATEDWTWALTPGVHWNPFVAQAKRGVVFVIEHDGEEDEFSYWGPATFDPSDGSDYSHVESVDPPYKGLGYPHWIVAGHHDPTFDAAPGGSGTGFDWFSTNLYAEDGAEAGALLARDEVHILYGFGAERSVPGDATIDGIRVRLQGARVNGTGGAPYVRVSLSWDGGSSWTSATASDPWSTVAENLAVGGTTWGRTWSPAEMDNLQVKLEFKCLTACALRNWFVDNVDMRVFWHQ